MDNEVEATFLNIDKDAVRNALSNAGYTLRAPEYLMRRKTFDLPSGTGSKKWGRVRQESDKVTMTVKHIVGAGINDTYEVEIVVDDFDRACVLLEACGIEFKAFQENRREAWSKDSIDVTIDTWPGLAPFVEVEGRDEVSVRVASVELGFTFECAFFGSIDLVYERELGISSANIIAMPEITFASPPIKENTA